MKDLPVKLWFFIAAISLLRIIVASSLALGNDEVYYWTYALHIEWNYFDHPPFVAWLIRTTTANLYLHNELAVRFGAIISSAICTIIVFKTGKLLLSERVGWYAVLLYTSSFYCSIIAGTFILPDSPQMVFWLWSIYLLIKITRFIKLSLPTLNLWYWFGLATGLCMMCKIHGIFLWFAVLLFALINNRKMLFQKGLYISMLISLVVISPVIIWNIQHHFITYTYHSDRVSLFHAGINPLAFAREISGEIFYNNPMVFFLVWTAVFGLFRKKYHQHKSDIRVLLCCGLPLIFTLIFLSIFRDTLPHWSGPAYTCLIFLSALQLESYTPPKAKLMITASLLFFFAIVVTALPMIHFYKGSFSSDQDALHFGKGDPSLDLYGWRETGKIIDTVYNMEKDKTIHTMVITKWFPAAHLDFYTNMQTGLNTYGIGEIFDLHQYYWSNRLKHKLTFGDNAYYIIPSNLYDENDLNFVKRQFKGCNKPLILPVLRNGAICKNILIFKLKGYKKRK
ncbi:glycosyltransferase family 39 protein [Pedobacter miscanthi]|uniref:ArnT family glycosyltransferase n=1 Tax=Pedobacter miscanthi TaxID=2259170 RepID=UPI00292DA694|nr:glycosyltransferase family 39 protein [Pedobacter miscanthi]